MSEARPDSVVPFYRGLLADGRASLTTSDAAADRELTAAVACLLERAAAERHTLADTPPVPDCAAAQWAARMLYRAAQFIAFRELGAELIPRDLQPPCPAAASPAVCYGVDLAFRFLPDLLRLARSLSDADPLLEVLQCWAAEWPLSSVGISGVTPGPIDDFFHDPALRMLYLDRIIRCGDAGRLDDPRVAAAAAAVLGAHPELAPRIAGALEALEHPPA